MRKLLNLANVFLALSVAVCAATSTGNKPAASLPPIVGAIRATSVSDSPAEFTPYALYATNAFGRTVATVSIAVH
jgi:hypothetical protein